MNDLPSDDDRITILRSLAVVVRRGRQVSQQTVSVIDPRLDPSSFPLLTFLKRSPGASLSDLAAAQGVSKGTMSRQVARLEAFGLITRDADAQDCRTTRLRLTEGGGELVQKMRDGQLAALEGALAGWNEPDLADLARLLSRFATALEGSPAAHHCRGAVTAPQ